MGKEPPPFAPNALQLAATKLAADKQGRGTPTLRTDYDDKRHAVRTWHFQGKACRKQELPKEGRAKQFAGYNLIREDLKDVERWLAFAHRLLDERGFEPPGSEDSYVSTQPDDTGVQLKAMFFAAVTCYGKCFTQADGRGVKLELDHVASEHRAKHLEVMEYRHQLTAHAGKHSFKHAEYAQPVIVHPPPFYNGVPLARVEMTRLEFMDDRTDPVPFLTLVRGVAAKVSGKIDALSKQLEEQARS
jgi:hypothetical protein